MVYDSVIRKYQVVGCHTVVDENERLYVFRVVKRNRRGESVTVLKNIYFYFNRRPYFRNMVKHHLCATVLNKTNEHSLRPTVTITQHISVCSTTPRATELCEGWTFRLPPPNSSSRSTFFVRLSYFTTTAGWHDWAKEERKERKEMRKKKDRDS